jgi:ubiquinone/menaquinone biosynthesis C-methylase UbiE
MAAADRQFVEPRLAELYDAFCSARRDFDFYLPLVLRARTVLDVGCGTGQLLRLARKAGHTGHLCGLDPANAMLDVARDCPDVEWTLGDLRSVRRDQSFDLIVMTGHAFQVFVRDEDIRQALAIVRSLIAPDGRFAFETRHPLARAWTNWTPENASEVTTPAREFVRNGPSRGHMG